MTGPTIYDYDPVSDIKFIIDYRRSGKTYQLLTDTLIHLDTNPINHATIVCPNYRMCDYLTASLYKRFSGKSRFSRIKVISFSSFRIKEMLRRDHRSDIHSKIFYDESDSIDLPPPIIEQRSYYYTTHTSGWTLEARNSLIHNDPDVSITVDLTVDLTVTNENELYLYRIGV